MQHEDEANKANTLLRTKKLRLKAVYAVDMTNFLMIAISDIKDIRIHGTAAFSSEILSN